METNGHSIPEEIRDIEYLYTSRFCKYIHMKTARSALPAYISWPLFYLFQEKLHFHTVVPFIGFWVEGTAYEFAKTEFKEVETFRQEAKRTC